MGSAVTGAVPGPAPVIVQLGKFYPPEGGGAEAVTRDLALAFAAKGWQSNVVAFGHARNDETVDGVLVERRPLLANVKSQPISLSWLWQAMRRIRQADAVIVHAPNFLAAVAVLLSARRPTILFWHSDVADKGWLGRLLRPLERSLIARATKIWATTRDYALGSPALRDVLDKTELVTLGIADPLETDAGASLPERVAALLDGGERRLVLTVGRLVPYKGFDQLLHAFARVASPCVLVIAGIGPQHRSLATLINELGLAGRVLLFGRASVAELHALFRSADLFVMSSVGRTEAFGMVQAEAMAFSLPIVATDVPRSGVGWVSDYGALGGLVPINDPPALAAAIDATLSRDDLPALRRKSRARFERLFRRERMDATAAAGVGQLIGLLYPRIGPLPEPAQDSAEPIG